MPLNIVFPKEKLISFTKKLITAPTSSKSIKEMVATEMWSIQYIWVFWGICKAIAKKIFLFASKLQQYSN